MSRTFDGSSGRIDHGGAMTKPTAGTGLSWGAWIYPTGWGENSLGRVTVFESTHGLTLSNQSSEAALRGFIGYASTISDRRSVSSFLNLNAWQFVAMTWNGGTTAAAIKLYKGLPGGVPAEPASYVDITNSSGGLSSFGNLNVGNRAADDRTFAGRISHAFYVNRVLTDAELAVAMYSPALLQGMLLLAPVAGFSPEPDLSGGANNGTISGSVVAADGPPVGRWIPHALPWPPSEFTSSIVQAASLPYAMDLGHVLDLPYATDLGHVLEMPYETVQGIFNRLELPFETLYGMATYHTMILPFETVPGLILHAAHLPYATRTSVTIVAPHRTDSRVEPS